MARRRLLALLPSAAICAGFAAPTGAQTPDVTLPSRCVDQKVAPARVVITCGDGGVIAHDLVWSNWGAGHAHATGMLSVNTCDPDCATRGREEYSVELVANRLRDCDYGKPQYTRVSYSFPADSPFPPGSPGADDPTVQFACPERPHGNPRIKRMRLWLTGHRAPGPRYFVRVHVRLRVCAVRGRSQLIVNETKRVGGQTFGRHTRMFKFRQRSRCQRSTFQWRLRDEFFGIGTYKVAAFVYDRDFQFSKTVSRKIPTLD
jgi:hypothetical protein